MMDRSRPQLIDGRPFEVVGELDMQIVAGEPTRPSRLVPVLLEADIAPRAIRKAHRF